MHCLEGHAGAAFWDGTGIQKNGWKEWSTLSWRLQIMQNVAML
jgi:hypothetical protein